MKLMHWSFDDLQRLPYFHYEVLLDMLQEEMQHAEHRRALSEIRAEMKHRRKG